MKNKLFSILLALTAVLVFSCNKEIDEPLDAEKEYDISGIAQKGPFINGSDIQIYELDKKFRPTGKTFHANTDKTGAFQLKGIKLSSSYVEILAEGFYFDEVKGDLSSEKISLKSIVDLCSNKTVHINVLTNLEYDRVKYLINSKDMSFKNAKKQAQTEILSLFDINGIQIDNPEDLDILNSGQGDAALLAISAILQVNRKTSELSKLHADIVLDMKEDGILNDSTIKTSLLTQATTINIEKVKSNLVEYYSKLGVVLGDINNFDVYVNNFIKNSNPDISPFEFPASTSTGTNVLESTQTEFASDLDYAFAVKMPGTGSIKVKLTLIEGSGIWFYKPMEAYGWRVSTYNAGVQTFTSTLNGVVIDVPVLFGGAGKAIVEYFYNESSTPSFTKTIKWGIVAGQFEFPNLSPAGQNLYALKDSIKAKSGEQYTVGLTKRGQFEVRFIVYHDPDVTIEVTGGNGGYKHVIIDDHLEFTLFGYSEISEIALKFTGQGQINIGSSIQNSDGSYMTRTVFVEP